MSNLALIIVFTSMFKAKPGPSFFSFGEASQDAPKISLKTSSLDKTVFQYSSKFFFLLGLQSNEKISFQFESRKPALNFFDKEGDFLEKTKSKGKSVEELFGDSSSKEPSPVGAINPEPESSQTKRQRLDDAVDAQATHNNATPSSSSDPTLVPRMEETTAGATPKTNGNFSNIKLPPMSR